MRSLLLVMLAGCGSVEAVPALTSLPDAALAAEPEPDAPWPPSAPDAAVVVVPEPNFDVTVSIAGLPAPGAHLIAGDTDVATAADGTARLHLPPDGQITVGAQQVVDGTQIVDLVTILGAEPGDELDLAFDTSSSLLGTVKVEFPTPPTDPAITTCHVMAPESGLWADLPPLGTQLDLPLHPAAVNTLGYLDVVTVCTGGPKDDVTAVAWKMDTLYAPGVVAKLGSFRTTTGFHSVPAAQGSAVPGAARYYLTGELWNDGRRVFSHPLSSGTAPLTGTLVLPALSVPRAARSRVTFPDATFTELPAPAAARLGHAEVELADFVSSTQTPMNQDLVEAPPRLTDLRLDRRDPDAITVRWAYSAALPAADGGIARLTWSLGKTAVWSWTVVFPPGTTEVTLPRLPDALAAWRPSTTLIGASTIDVAVEIHDSSFIGGYEDYRARWRDAGGAAAEALGRVRTTRLASN